MALKLSNIMISYVIFSMLVVLFSGFYTAMVDNYEITPTDTEDGQTIMQQLSELNLPEGMQSVLEGAVDITNPASTADIIGGFLSVGIGVFKTATGLVTFPIGVIGVITGTYFIPPVVSSGLGLIVIILISMMLLNKSTGGND